MRFSNITTAWETNEAICSANSFVCSRNLSFNELRYWEVNSTHELQRLNYVDVTGNGQWLPSEQLLQLTNLYEVTGLRISRHCEQCDLVKDSDFSADEPASFLAVDHFSPESQMEWEDKIQFGTTLDFITSGFFPTCLMNDVCYIDQYHYPFATAVDDVTVKSSFALYTTGSMALLVNLTVVLFVLFNKSLRGDLTVRLILNIAVCDVLIGLVTILYARFHYDSVLVRYLEDSLRENNAKDGAYGYDREWQKFQNIMGPILTSAVTSEVFGSFILMLEKFLKIVFAMKPELRVGRRTALMFLMFSWILSVTFGVLPVFEVGNMKYTEEYSVTPLPADAAANGNHTFRLAAGLQIALLMIQFVSFVLYVPIFAVVKKSGANVGVRREGTLAKKIALLIFTSLIFFTVPVIMAAFQNQIADKVSMGRYTFQEFQWLRFVGMMFPMFCLSLSALLNPFLYAVRHPKIIRKMRLLGSRCQSTFTESFGSLRQHIRSQPDQVHPQVLDRPLQTITYEQR